MLHEAALPSTIGALACSDWWRGAPASPRKRPQAGRGAAFATAMHELFRFPLAGTLLRFSDLDRGHFGGD
jgi:hypothetical protein